MNQLYEQVARLAAAQLAQELNIGTLPKVLDDYISSIQTEQEPSISEGLRLTDRKIALSALLCEAAALGLSIYTLLTQLNSQPPVTVNNIEYQLKIEIIQQINPDRYYCLPMEEQNRAVEVVVEKILNQNP